MFLGTPLAKFPFKYYMNYSFLSIFDHILLSCNFTVQLVTSQPNSSHIILLIFQKTNTWPQSQRKQFLVKNEQQKLQESCLYST